VVGVIQVVDDDQVMLITDGGQVLRCRVSGISTMGRATQGVRLINLEPGEQLAAMAKLAEREDAADTREVVPSAGGARSERAELETSPRKRGRARDRSGGRRAAGPDGDEE
jgi:hypothetical protein